MKKNNLFIGLLCGLFMFQACTEEDIINDITEDMPATDAINNEAGAKGLVTAVYNKFLAWNMSSFSWIGMTSIVSDDADKGSSPSDNGADKNLLDNFQYDPTSPSIIEIFDANYEGINRANQALQNLPLLDKVDPVLIERLTSESKFLRAIFYFNLVRAYGAVPLVDMVDVSNKDMLYTRVSTDEIYAFLEKDLKKAIEVLPEKTAYPAEDLGRATKGAAKALLAKMYLYQQKWTETKTMTDELIASGEYALLADYAQIWREVGENKEESIFEIQAVGVPPVLGINNYSVCQGARGEGGWGWGFATPTQNLVDSYEAGDVRKDATVIFKDENMWDGRYVPNTVANNYYNEKAYASPYMEDYNGGGDSNKNLRILRYGDILLINAEANNELGNTAEAVNKLNMIRNRAGLANTTATAQADVRMAIWEERRFELAFEHDRFFDLVRQGRAAEVMQAHGKNFVAGKHELFPVPQRFLDQATGMATQNPGY